MTVSWSLTPFRNLSFEMLRRLSTQLRNRCAHGAYHGWTMAVELWPFGEIRGLHGCQHPGVEPLREGDFDLKGTWATQVIINISIHIYIPRICVWMWILHKTHLHNLHTDINDIMYSFNKTWFSFNPPSYRQNIFFTKARSEDPKILAPRPGASCHIWPLDHKRNDQDLARVPGLPKSGKPYYCVWITGHGKHLLRRIFQQMVVHWT